jgi:hypothetical protein
MKKLSPGEIIDMLGGTAATAALSHSAWSTVSDWRHMEAIPPYKLVLLAHALEQKTNGKINRKKLFPKTWAQIWPELESK